MSQFNTSDLPTTDADIQMVFHKGNVHVNCNEDDRFIIEPYGDGGTMALARRLTPEHWQWLRQQPRFMELLRCVFPAHDYPDAAFSPSLTMHGSGMQHVVGMIVLILAAQREGKRVFLRYPESCLHPSAQLGLGDMLIRMGAA